MVDAELDNPVSAWHNHRWCGHSSMILCGFYIKGKCLSPTLGSLLACDLCTGECHYLTANVLQMSRSQLW